MNAYQLLQKMALSKQMTETVRRAIRVRLEVILQQEISCYEKWKTDVKHKLNVTRQKQVEREFLKKIQAAKIVVHWLTPYFERTEDVPLLVIKKKKV
jgi:hypothetical protein